MIFKCGLFLHWEIFSLAIVTKSWFKWLFFFWLIDLCVFWKRLTNVKVKNSQRKLRGGVFPNWCWQTYEMGICCTKIVVKNGWVYLEGSERQIHAMPPLQCSPGPCVYEILITLHCYCRYLMKWISNLYSLLLFHTRLVKTMGQCKYSDVYLL